MPNRYLRAGYIDSVRVNKLSAEGERLFCRLLVHVDDFGRCEALPELLLGKLFALQVSKLSSKDIKRWLDELQRHDLLFLYVVDGKQYVQMNRWEQGRAKASRFPQPPTDVNICKHVRADAPDSDSDSDSDTDSGPPKSPRRGSGGRSGFKSWSVDEFRGQVVEANGDGLLSPDELEDFVGYWCEPNGSGRPRFSMEKTWDTRLRMQRALRVIFEGRRKNNGARGGKGKDFEHVVGDGKERREKTKFEGV